MKPCRFALLLAAALHIALPAQAQPVADFDADGNSDIFWRNSATGETYLYPMDGTTILGTEGYVRTVADQNWQVAGIGNFDGTGGADILWRNAATGENYIYLMNGKDIVGEGYLRTVADLNWKVAGVGDFDGDGKSDILWRNTVTGENYLYPMDGLAIKAGEGYLRAVADAAWHIAAIGDFGGEGTADILWRNETTGENYVYLMNGTAIAGEGYLRTVADQNWQVAGAADFDGDGRADILWRNGASGENYLYPMAGTTILPGEGYLRTVADQNWQVAALGDYDADGSADIFWRNGSTGENYLYPMSGLSVLGGEGYLRTVPGAWRVAAAHDADCAEWVDIAGAQIMKYEAARPDATSSAAGIFTNRACSRPAVRPWTNLTRARAEAACQASGARLCTEQEWHRACAVVAGSVYPRATPAGTGQLFIEAEDFFASSRAISGGVSRAWVPDYALGFSGIAALRALPDTGASLVDANVAPVESPRLDFQISFSEPGNHFVWVRMYNDTSAANTLWLGIGADPSTVVPSRTLTNFTNSFWVWVRADAINIAAAGIQFVSLFMREDGLRVDAIVVTRSSSTTAPTTTTNNGGDWAFATSPDVYQSNTCNGADFDTDSAAPGNQDAILASGSRPSCYANWGAGSAIFDLSGNVREWAAARNANENPRLGGGSIDDAQGISCAAASVVGDPSFSPETGFRCCR